MYSDRSVFHFTSYLVILICKHIINDGSVITLLVEVIFSDALQSQPFFSFSVPGFGLL